MDIKTQIINQIVHQQEKRLQDRFKEEAIEEFDKVGGHFPLFLLMAINRKWFELTSKN